MWKALGLIPKTVGFGEGAEKKRECYLQVEKGGHVNITYSQDVKSRFFHDEGYVFPKQRAILVIIIIVSLWSCMCAAQET